MIRTAFAALILLSSPLSAQTKNLFLIMPDGMRWQEVFRGVDADMLTKDHKIDNAAPFKDEFVKDTPEAQREALMPFLWTTVAKQGQIYGNRDKGSIARVTNPHWFSYPGYSETLCGFVEPAIDSNKKLPNPNTTVFEFLHAKPAFAGKVAAFGTWDVFPFIFNAERSGFPVDDGIGPLSRGTLTPAIHTINTLRKETPRRWSSCHFDSLSFRAAKEWIGANKPRVCFIGLGETDEWAHEGDYGQYLRAAQRDDAYIRELWDFCQSDPQYQNSTTFIITTDHGRGDKATSPKDWNNHNAKSPGSDAIWIAVIGPSTPALGERTNCEPVTQSQIAATIASLLGENYNAAEPRAALPLQEVIKTNSR